MLEDPRCETRYQRGWLIVSSWIFSFFFLLFVIIVFFEERVAPWRDCTFIFGWNCVIWGDKLYFFLADEASVILRFAWSSYFFFFFVLLII